MGRITVFANPMDPDDAQEYEHVGPFIDFLLREFPGGFPGPHVTVFNMRKLEVADYDKVVEKDDTVVATSLPGFPAAFAAAYLGGWFAAGSVSGYILAAVVTTALSYAINRFFGPKGSAPSTAAIGSSPLGAGSPTYNLNTPSNVARLGECIPVQYGQVLAVPDIASAPYSRFEGNNQYVRMLLCLGQGEYDIHEIQVAGSNIATLGGTVSAVVFPPSAHGQTYGVIGAASGVNENVYTSPSVSDQELTAAKGGTFYSTGQQYNGSFNSGDGGGYAVFWLDNAGDAVEYAEAIRNGTPVWMIIDDGPNWGTWRVGFIVNSGNSGGHSAEWMYHKGTVEGPWVGDSSSNMRLAYDISGGEGSTIGPFAATPVGVKTSLLEYDLVWPSGCYQVSSKTGRLESFSVDVSFTAEEIDDDGNTTGAVYSYGYSETFSSNTAQRRSIQHNVPFGRYQVTAYRTSLMSDKAQDQSSTHWTALKAYLGNTFGGPVYGDVTMVAVTAKATEGLASDAIARISIDATRKLNGVATRNPILAFKDVITNRIYGGRRPLTELDMPRMNELEVAWAGKHFDAVFDTKSTLWEVAGATLQVQHAAPSVSGSVITIVEDKNYVVPVMAFTEDTIKEDTLSISYMFATGNDKDGVEISYRDPGDGAELYALWPETSADPETLQLPGCRDYATALAYAKQRWLQVTLRRRIITFDTELDAHVIPVGSPVNVVHRLLGDEPVLHIVNSVSPKEGFTVTVMAHRHEPGVFA